MKFVHDRIKKAHTHTSNCSQASFTYIDTLVKQKIWPIIKNVWVYVFGFWFPCIVIVHVHVHVQTLNFKLHANAMFAP